MKLSTERILTTHTGSLPRPEDLIRMMFAKEEGIPVEPHALAHRIRDHRSLTRDERELGAHGLERHEQIGEYDGRVYAELLGGLDRHGAREIGRLTELEQGDPGAQRAEPQPRDDRDPAPAHAVRGAVRPT